MPIIPKNARTLYENLKADGYELDDPETFMESLSEPEVRRTLYENLKADGYTLDNFEKFDNRIWYQYQPVERRTFNDVRPYRSGAVQSLATTLGTFYNSLGNLFENSDAVAQYLESRLHLNESAGVKGGAFKNVSEYLYGWGDYLRARGIPESDATMYKLARASSEFVGETSGFLAKAATLGGGAPFSAIPALGAISSGGESSAKGEDVLKNTASAYATGTLLSSIYRGLNVFTRPIQMTVDAVVGGGRALLEELSKPSDKRNYERVAVESVGSSLMNLFYKPGTLTLEGAWKDFKNTRTPEFRRLMKATRTAAEITESDKRVYDILKSVDDVLNNPKSSETAKTAVAAKTRIEILREKFPGIQEGTYVLHPDVETVRARLRQTLDAPETAVDNFEYIRQSPVGRVLLHEELTRAQEINNDYDVKRDFYIEALDLQRKIGLANLRAAGRIAEQVEGRTQLYKAAEVMQTLEAERLPKAADWEVLRDEAKRYSIDKHPEVRELIEGLRRLEDERNNALVQTARIGQENLELDISRKFPDEYQTSEGSKPSEQADAPSARRGKTLSRKPSDDVVIRRLEKRNKYAKEDFAGLSAETLRKLEAAALAGKGNLGEALDEIRAALKLTDEGLKNILGDPQKLGIIPYNDANFAAARDKLKEAWEHYKRFGNTFSQYVSDLVLRYGDEVRPYLERLHEELGEPETHRTPIGEIVAPKLAQRVLNVAKVDDSRLFARAVALRMAQIDPKYASLSKPHRANLIKKIERIMKGVETTDDPTYLKALEVFERNRLKNRISKRFINGDADPKEVVAEFVGSGIRYKLTADELSAAMLLSSADLKSGTRTKGGQFIIDLVRGKQRREAFIEHVYKPMLEADGRYYKHIENEERLYTDVKRRLKLPKDWKERIGIALMNAQEGYVKPALEEQLRVQGKKNVTINDLTPDERRLAGFYMQRFDVERQYINAANKRIGFPEIEPNTSYFSVFRQFNEDEVDDGINPFLSVSNYRIFKPGKAAAHFLETRVKSDRPMILNADYIFRRSLRNMAYHAAYSPLIAKFRAMMGTYYVEGLGGQASGTKIHSPSETSPRLYNFLQDRADAVGQKIMFDRYLPKIVRKAMYAIHQNVGASLMSFKISSALVQMSALGETMHAIGVKNTIAGISALANIDDVNMAFRESDVLRSRFPSDFIEETHTELTRTSLSRARQAVSKVGTAWLRFNDYHTAMASWLGSYKRAVKHMDHRQAVLFADDVVLRTQASVSRMMRPEITRGIVGKFLTLFNSFTLNRWNYIAHNVLKVYDENATAKDRVISAARFMFITSAINSVYELIGRAAPFTGLRRPNPDPVWGVIEHLEKGEDLPQALLFGTVGEAIDMIPVLGGATRGGSLFGAGETAVTDVLKAASGEYNLPMMLRTAGTILGFAGTGQLYQWYKIRNEMDKQHAREAAKDVRIRRVTRGERSTRKSVRSN